MDRLFMHVQKLTVEGRCAAAARHEGPEPSNFRRDILFVFRRALRDRWFGARGREELISLILS